jgi:hypothetical protein
MRYELGNKSRVLHGKVPFIGNTINMAGISICIENNIIVLGIK